MLVVVIFKTIDGRRGFYMKMKMVPHVYRAVGEKVFSNIEPCFIGNKPIFLERSCVGVMSVPDEIKP